MGPWGDDVLFFVFNCVLPSVDMGTDLSTFFLLMTIHPKWAAITLFWMFVPFIIRIIQTIHHFVQAPKDFTYKILSAVYHLPFVLPLYNLYLLLKLRKVRRNAIRDEAKASVKKTEILSKVGDSSLYESFCEAGPQGMFYVKLNNDILTEIRPHQT